MACPSVHVLDCAVEEAMGAGVLSVPWAAGEGKLMVGSLIM